MPTSFNWSASEKWIDLHRCYVDVIGGICYLKQVDSTLNWFRLNVCVQMISVGPVESELLFLSAPVTSLIISIIPIDC